MPSVGSGSGGGGSVGEEAGGGSGGRAGEQNGWMRRLVDPRLSGPASRVVGAAVGRAGQRRRVPVPVRSMLRVRAGKRRRGLVDDVSCLVLMLEGGGSAGCGHDLFGCGGGAV